MNMDEKRNYIFPVNLYLCCC